MPKIGIFGGTFDPVHLGHLILAEQAREQLALDQVLLIPAAVPPHKQTAALTPGKRRLEMLHLAVAGNPGLDVSDVELVRGGVSYTVDTLRALRESRPNVAWHLLIGADNLRDFAGWREAAEIPRLAHLAVARRPGDDVLDFTGLEAIVPADALAEMCRLVVEIPLLEISSTDVRRRAAAGRSIRYLVPAAVEAYILAHELYQT